MPGVALWKRRKWYGTSDPTITKLFDSYALDYRNGTMWMRVYKKLDSDGALGCKYHFTSQYGHNSRFSFSGLLPPEFNNLSLEEAQALVKLKIREQNGWTR